MSSGIDVSWRLGPTSTPTRMWSDSLKTCLSKSPGDTEAAGWGGPSEGPCKSQVPAYSVLLLPLFSWFFLLTSTPAQASPRLENILHGLWDPRQQIGTIFPPLMVEFGKWADFLHQARCRVSTLLSAGPLEPPRRTGLDFGA